jgi:hypothetical protein
VAEQKGSEIDANDVSMKAFFANEDRPVRIMQEITHRTAEMTPRDRTLLLKAMVAFDNGDHDVGLTFPLLEIAAAVTTIWQDGYIQALQDAYNGEAVWHAEWAQPAKQV